MKLLMRLDSLAAPRAGIGYYTEHLARGLIAMPQVDLTGVFHGHRVAGAELAQLLDDPGEPATVGHAWRQRLTPVLRALPGAYALRQMISDRRSARCARDFSLYHEPSFIPFPFQGTTVLTVHDLSHLRHPQYHPPERVRFLQRYLPEALRRAAAVIVDSQFTADECADYFPWVRDKVFPVHLGVEETIGVLPEEQVRGVLAGYGLPFKSYILSVATLEPRKNIAGLVRAYRALPPAVQRELPLVLVGGAGWRNAELEALLAEQADAGRIILTGRVPRTHLSGLLNGARLFAYPSFYEGFGLPIAEARACGTPVLTTHYGAMAEVAGDDAFLVAPENLTEGLAQALTSMPQTLAPYRYNWRQTAQKTLQVYQTVS